MLVVVNVMVEEKKKIKKYGVRREWRRGETRGTWKIRVKCALDAFDWSGEVGAMVDAGTYGTYTDFAGLEWALMMHLCLGDFD